MGREADVERWGSELGAAVRKVVAQIHLLAPSLVGVSMPEAETRLKENDDEILKQLHTLSAGRPSPVAPA